MTKERMTPKEALLVAIERFNPDADKQDAEIVDVLREIITSLDNCGDCVRRLTTTPAHDKLTL